jgi:hypothetical protein
MGVPFKMRTPTLVRLLVILAGAALWAPGLLCAQVPRDQVHISLSLGGYVKLGVGYTAWIEEHHALEFTVYPLAYPFEGLHMDLKAGYNWIPSDEVWRAKLGAAFTLLIHKPSGDGGWFTPLLSFTPGLHYAAKDERSVRVDLPMSYYITESVFAPTGLEFIYGFRS